MLGRLLGEDITISLSLDPMIPRVVLDPKQLEQIILNLAVNARDAMPNGGSLEITTSQDERDGEPVVKTARQDETVTRIELNFNQSRKQRSSEQVTNVSKGISWASLSHDVAEFPEIQELQGLAATAEELMHLTEREDLLEIAN